MDGEDKITNNHWNTGWREQLKGLRLNNAVFYTSNCTSCCDFVTGPMSEHGNLQGCSHGQNSLLLHHLQAKLPLGIAVSAWSWGWEDSGTTQRLQHTLTWAAPPEVAQAFSWASSSPRCHCGDNAMQKQKAFRSLPLENWSHLSVWWPEMQSPLEFWDAN